MTNNQLYLAIGIPACLFALNFLAVLAAAFWQAKRFDDMSKRFDDMKDWVRSEISRVEGVLGAKIDGLTIRVKALEDEIRSPLVKR
jgi:DNA-binding transcriptional regulator of glucitol operon